MRILNIKIKDFRNIVRADVDFGPINILTGKNSSGKSNFLLALGQSLNREKDHYESFKNNVVTYHPGKDRSILKTTVGDMNTNICYIDGEDNSFFCVEPKKFTFDKTIDTSGFSINHKLYYTGKYYDNKNNKEITWDTFQKDRQSKNLYENSKNELVYEENFSKDTLQRDTKVVRVSKSAISNQENFLNSFSDLNNTIVSWANMDSKIYDFVTERGTREIYEQVLDRLKTKKDTNFRVSTTLFNRSKFIFLLADLQTNDKQYKNFQEDLRTYTDGIVTNIFINTKGVNKGEISVDSPNGPKNIWTVSSGTAVILFFILLLNWTRLTQYDRRYISPNVMIFDEIDSLIHPSLIPHFKEVLDQLSNKIQLFISSHSPYFINHFEKNELFLLKDTPSMTGSKKTLMNRCNIYDYNKIISFLPTKDREIFSNKSNSELFVDGLIDSIFPSREHD